MKKAKKRISVICTLLFASLIMTVPASAAVTKTEALHTALKDAGLKQSQIKNLSCEKDKNTYEIEFIKKSSCTEYDYEISKSSGKILEKSVEYVCKHNASKKKIGKKTAVRKVSKASGIKASVIRKGTCRYRYKKHEGTYKIKFRSGNWSYEYELLAPTGKIIEFSKEYVTSDE